MLATEGEAKDGVDDETEAVNIQEEDEVEPLVVSTSPVQPTAAEVEEHRVTHLPFRRWCRECMMGRGIGEQRGRHAGRSHSIAIVGVDYFFITSRGVESKNDIIGEFPEDEDGTKKLEAAREAGSIVKCIMIRCHHRPRHPLQGPGRGQVSGQPGRSGRSVGGPREGDP